MVSPERPAGEAGLSASHDTYDARQQGSGANWVEGPNRQFLAMAEAMETGAWGAYRGWYLMEMDSAPARLPPCGAVSCIVFQSV